MTCMNFSPGTNPITILGPTDQGGNDSNPFTYSIFSFVQ